MRAVDIIIKKRDRRELTRQEIEFFIQGYTSGQIPDYQAAAFAMAVLLNDMTPRETTDLTLAMAATGDRLDLSDVVPIAVDKHSTGGVGDKTTLVVAPLVASCGVPVGKLSGRGLGFSGGTLDKMEAIPGYRTNLSTAEFIKQLGEIGLVLTGQTGDLAPADGKFYALRDVTGTVQSTPLIASSIMSKKIASGVQAIVLDVKIGEGAFMKDLEQARTLASLMVAIAKQANLKAVALLSDMNQPLGQAVGNALEVCEAIETLRGGGPQDFREHCLTVTSAMLVLGSKVSGDEEARQMAEVALREGHAWKKFVELVKAQGGDSSYIEKPEKLPRAALIETVKAPRTGYLSAINARIIGEAAVNLGAGRARKEDPIDHSVGIEILHKVGDRIASGEALFILHACREDELVEARHNILAAHAWSDLPVDPLPLFYGVVKDEQA